MNFREFILREMSVERVERIVSGLAHDVNTIAILTPENPQAQKFDKKHNQLFVSQFIDFMRSNGVTPIEIGGKFGGNEERSFIIKNVSKKQAIEIGKMYNQQSVIWGKKVDDSPTPHFHYEYIEGGKTVSTSFKLNFGQEAQTRSDNYSNFRKKKFVIPFFDPDGSTHR